MLISPEQHKVKELLEEGFSIRNPLSVTLTSHQWVPYLGALDKSYLERDITFFLHRLNYEIFRKKYSRYRKKLGVLPVVEGKEGKNLHVHLSLELPGVVSFVEMESLIRRCWGRTRYGRSNKYFAVQVVPVIDEGWIEYQLKERTKDEGLTSSIDWINLSGSSSE